jgi:hypothetical protein
MAELVCLGAEGPDGDEGNCDKSDEGLVRRI